jgi:hypothetical protein
MAISQVCRSHHHRDHASKREAMTIDHTLPDLFACPACGAVPPFRPVEGGFQQEVCPRHPPILPNGDDARGPYLQATDRPGSWLLWRMNTAGKLEIDALELPVSCIAIIENEGE